MRLKCLQSPEELQERHLVLFESRPSHESRAQLQCRVEIALTSAGAAEMEETLGAPPRSRGRVQIEPTSFWHWPNAFFWSPYTAAFTPSRQGSFLRLFPDIVEMDTLQVVLRNEVQKFQAVRVSLKATWGFARLAENGWVPQRTRGCRLPLQASGR